MKTKKVLIICIIVVILLALIFFIGFSKHDSSRMFISKDDKAYIDLYYSYFENEGKNAKYFTFIDFNKDSIPEMVLTYNSNNARLSFDEIFSLSDEELAEYEKNIEDNDEHFEIVTIIDGETRAFKVELGFISCYYDSLSNEIVWLYSKYNDDSYYNLKELVDNKELPDPISFNSIVEERKRFGYLTHFSDYEVDSVTSEEDLYERYTHKNYNKYDLSDKSIEYVKERMLEENQDYTLLCQKKDKYKNMVYNRVHFALNTIYSVKSEIRVNFDKTPTDEEVGKLLDYYTDYYGLPFESYVYYDNSYEFSYMLNEYEYDEYFADLSDDLTYDNIEKIIKFYKKNGFSCELGYY